jgi:hypothetical protein
MKNSQLRIRFNRMSFTAYSHSLCHKKHEPSKLNYCTFSNELTSLGMNSLSSPFQMDVVYKN